ncbi:fibronectin type III domain-containing protein [Chryseobacterium sp. Y16C]|uniref:fibronectin type III domain-containing protein n=1 Tax=Chryseobacterium sp. Y16C TaxID=2920939 RepID=UPI001F0AAF91|nr:fibronectin type III domain-containing protein [Chryseobacterium sp. Y16C]UMQ40964.1 fibronectin type III domain-containing protein [Chryseobacterium sp. Y16C]
MQLSFAQLWTNSYCSGLPSTTQSNTYGPMYSTATANSTSRLTAIYPASQLAGITSQVLTSMYFHTGAGNAGGMLGTPNFKIYLKEVSNLDWGSGALDWTTASTGATLVYNGNPASLIGTGGGWKQIPFTTNFTYSGTQNLAIFLEYNNPTANNAITWSYEFTSPCVSGSTTGNETKYSNNTTGTLPTSLTSTNSRRPYIGFDYVVTCPAPTNTTITGVTTNGAAISWTAGGTETSWNYAIQPAGSGVPTTYSTATTTTLNPSTLNPNTNYEFYVRAACGGTNGNSVWKGPYTFKTLCAPTTIMFENFDTTATGSVVPSCWDRIVPATSAGSQTVSTTTPASTPNNIYQYATSSQNPVIVVLPVFSNINAGTNWLRFKARISSGTGGALTVGYVTNAADASTFVTLQTLTINNTTFTSTDAEYTVAVPNTVPANARLAIKNATDSKSYYWDDVYWEVAPTCFPPSNVAVSAIAATTTQVSWTAASPIPSGGYNVYYSTSGTAPNSSTVLNSSNSVSSATTSATISYLTPATPYYVWVRSNCGNGDFSSWTQVAVQFSTLCQPPAITATTGANVCGSGTATLTATADTGADITWYDAATAGNQVGTGASFTTPLLTTTTNYWVTASTGSTAYVGKDTPVSTTGNNGWSDVGLVFNALTNTTIQTVDVYPMGSSSTGTLTIALKNSAGTVLQTKTVNVNVTSAGVLNTINLDFPVPAGTGYRLVVTAQTGLTYLVRESSSGFTYPYTLPGVISITSAYTSGASSSYYYYFYNWKVSTKCESARTMVTATVDSTCLGTSEAEAKENVKVHPNPFTEIININKSELVRTVKVIDVSGKLIRTINNPQSSINLQDISAGLYILTLEMKDGTHQSIKVIKK